MIVSSLGSPRWDQFHGISDFGQRAFPSSPDPVKQLRFIEIKFLALLTGNSRRQTFP
jgi:hypothetical protein